MESPIIIVLILVFVLVFYAFQSFSQNAKVKGDKGEQKVASLLNRLDKNQYKVINNLYLRSGARRTQIDHLIISVYGIFVIETKAFNGWIHGYENARYWKQTFYRKKVEFRNPVKQNETHMRFLKSVMPNFREVPHHSIIVFSGRGELKNVHTNTPVVYKQKLLKTIRNYDTVVLSFDQMDNYLKQLSPYFSTEKKVKQEHAQYVAKKRLNRKDHIKKGICPNCKGRLELKTGKYGKFYGCSNFPRCKFTTNT